MDVGIRRGNDSLGQILHYVKREVALEMCNDHKATWDAGMKTMILTSAGEKSYAEFAQLRGESGKPNGRFMDRHVQNPTELTNAVVECWRWKPIVPVREVAA
jgi:hypothetical protein